MFFCCLGMLLCSIVSIILCSCQMTGWVFFVFPVLWTLICLYAWGGKSIDSFGLLHSFLSFLVMLVIALIFSGVSSYFIAKAEMNDEKFAVMTAISKGEDNIEIIKLKNDEKIYRLAIDNGYSIEVENDKVFLKVRAKKEKASLTSSLCLTN